MTVIQPILTPFTTSSNTLGSPTPTAISLIKEIPKNAATANAKKFDIDSLNEVKRDVALQSKKLEITNYIFDLLINEIKEELIPIRKQDNEPKEVIDYLASSPSAA